MERTEEVCPLCGLPAAVGFASDLDVDVRLAGTEVLVCDRGHVTVRRTPS